MNVKNNDPTELRPEGARVIDAPLVNISITDFVKQLKAEATWQTNDRNAITVFKTNGFRIVLIALHEGAVIQEHSAEGTISVQVLEGEIKFGTRNESVDLKQNNMVVLHKGLHHKVEALKESVFLLTLTTSPEV